MDDKATMRARLADAIETQLGLKIAEIIAGAGLDALADPTPEMLRAGIIALQKPDTVMVPQLTPAEYQVLAVWRAMLDAAR